MKSTGEAMGIGRTFGAALLKAVRGLDLQRETLTGNALADWHDDELRSIIVHPTHERLFAIAELLRRKISPQRIAELSAIDVFWLHEIAELVELEQRLRGGTSDGDLCAAVESGYSQRGIAVLRCFDKLSTDEAEHDKNVQRDTNAHADVTLSLSKAEPREAGIQTKARDSHRTVFRMVDTAAAEFPARSPYYYISHDECDEMRVPTKEGVVVVGSGPIRIGQGIEFDYSCVHAAWALRDAGCSAVVVNNNPETVSTDFDISDTLIFEPPGADEVEAAYRATQARGVMLAFGGQTAINLAADLSKRGVRIMGSDRASVDMAEDRRKFDEALHRLGVARPLGKAATSFREARAIARELGFPVLVRPSYVLGGRGMEIVYNEGQLASYAESAPAIQAEAPLLVDKYLRGLEVEVDAVFDGSDILIPGIFEHIERAGIHSGDSISVYPTQTVGPQMEKRIVEVTTAIARELGIRGLINIQFVIHQGDLYIIEANPRASRTVPIISKATGVNIVAAATRIALGQRLRDMEYGTGLRPRAPFTVVKVPVFSFAKMRGVETILGPEMKSTGEVLGIDETFAGALRKGFLAAGIRLPEAGGRILATIADEEKTAAVSVLRRYANLGFAIHATGGTLRTLKHARIDATLINKIQDGSPHTLDLITSRGVDLVINDATGAKELNDSYRIRRAAVEANIACLTSLDTARALAEALESTAGPPRTLQDYRSLHQREIVRA